MAASSTIPATKQAAARRAEAVERVRATLRLEGVDFDGPALAVVDRYLAGEITSSRLTQELIALPL